MTAQAVVARLLEDDPPPPNADAARDYILAFKRDDRDQEGFKRFRQCAAAFVKMMGTDEDPGGFEVCHTMGDVQRIRRAKDWQTVQDILQQHESEPGMFMYFVREYC